MQQNTRHGTSNNLIITEITADLFWERFGYDSLETAQVSLGNYVVIDREKARGLLLVSGAIRAHPQLYALINDVYMPEIHLPIGNL